MKPVVSTSYPPSDRQDLDCVIKHFVVALIADYQINGFGQDFVGKTLIVADKTDANSRQLPEVVVFDLGN